MLEAQDEYGEDAFSAGIGAEAVKIMLQDLDLQREKGRSDGRPADHQVHTENQRKLSSV